jgi:hypothetical protein
MVMNSRRLFAAVVLAMLAALVLAFPASGAPLATLETHLTGEQEVPGPGDPDGRGNAVVKVFGTKVCYTLKVKDIRLTDLAAHIHKGRRGVAGDIVVTLEPPTGSFSSGCEDISRSLSEALREHPARYYVNVHNAKFSAGAIRGQLERD